jgi:hypothetical protein
VALDGTLVQRRSLAGLPAMRQPVLEELVVAQQSRFFRRRGTGLVCAARWQRHARGATDGVVTAVGVEAGLLDRLSESCADGPIRLRRIRCARTGLTLRPPRVGVARAASARTWMRRLLVVNAILWPLVPGAHAILLWRRDRRAVAASVALATKAATVESVRKLNRDAQQQLDVLEEAQARRPRVGEALATLATLLPDSAHIATLSLDANGEGFLTGTARPAAGVVAALERGRWPAPARLEGSPTPEGPGGWERFSIKLGRADQP